MSFPDEARLADVRDALARAGLAIGHAAPPHRLGPDLLHPHQRLAVARLRAALESLGGALLADAVGLGKTHVALALAHDARAPLVVAPAALRPTWTAAARTAGVPVRVVSVEALSRPNERPLGPDAPPDLVVVDEAHHFRTPATRRWQRLAALTRHARVLLLTATPVHNTARDLVALLALFLGDRARTLDSATLARLVVRRRAADLAAYRQRRPADTPPVRPVISRARWHSLPDDRALLDTLLTLPPPVPPRDGGHAGALATMSLVRLWASSDAALRAALHRRLTRAAALESALADGRHLTRRELAAWCPDDTTLQLGLALGAANAPPALPDRLLRDALAAHTAGCRRALALLDARPDHDAHRAAWLRTLRREHPGRVIVAFTQFADTARTLYRQLAPDGHVALLTAAGGRIASGAIPRHELLAQLATPRAVRPSPIDHVALLVATDCLAEGLDLRAASVVAHLDVPWTPARLAQRVGRAARLGAPHPHIHVHGLSPPAGITAWLQLGARLHRKATTARSLLGARSAITHLPTVALTGDEPAAAPRPGPRTVDDAALRVHLRMARLLERWVRLADDAPAAPRIVAVAADRPGFLAACLLDGQPLLVASDPHGRASIGARHVERALRRLHDVQASAALPPARRHRLVITARQAIARWARRHRASHAAGAALGTTTAALTTVARTTTARTATASPEALRTPPAATAPPPLVQQLLARAASAVAHAPAAHRAILAAESAELRHALERPLGAASERALAALPAELPDRAWLVAARAAVRPGESMPAHPPYGEPASRRPIRLLALVLLVS